MSRPLDWIKINPRLRHKPEVDAIARRCKIADTRKVVGILVEVWGYAEEVSDNGVIRFAALSTIDRLAGVRGFAQAMVDVGWLVIDGPEQVSIPAYDSYMGAASRARLAEAERKRAYRSADEQPGHGPGQSRDKAGTRAGTVAGQSRDTGRDSRGTKPALLEREREGEEDLKPSPPAGGGCGAATELPTVNPEPQPRTPAASATPPPARKPPGPRNELFDALCGVTGADPFLNAALIGKVSSRLGKATPPYTPADVREFARRYHELCPYAARNGSDRPTLPELEKNIGKLRAAPPQPVPAPGGAGPRRLLGQRDARYMAPPGLYADLPTWTEDGPPEGRAHPDGPAGGGAGCPAGVPGAA